MGYAGELDWTQRYEQSRAGFLTYCEESKTKFGDEETKHWADGIREAGLSIPCYAEIFKIVQWLNLICETLEYMDIPYEYVYYEDFIADYETSAEHLLDFYGMANVIPLAGTKPHEVRISHDVYNEKEKEEVMNYISFMASNCTKEVFARYYIKEKERRVTTFGVTNE